MDTERKRGEREREVEKAKKVRKERKRRLVERFFDFVSFEFSHLADVYCARFRVGGNC